MYSLAWYIIVTIVWCSGRGTIYIVQSNTNVSNQDKLDTWSNKTSQFSLSYIIGQILSIPDDNQEFLGSGL